MSAAACSIDRRSDGCSVSSSGEAPGFTGLLAGSGLLSMMATFRGDATGAGGHRSAK